MCICLWIYGLSIILLIGSIAKPIYNTSCITHLNLVSVVSCSRLKTQNIIQYDYLFTSKIHRVSNRKGPLIYDGLIQPLSTEYPNQNTTPNRADFFEWSRYSPNPSKCKTFHTWKFILEYHLRNGAHFVQREIYAHWIHLAFPRSVTFVNPSLPSAAIWCESHRKYWFR